MDHWKTSISIIDETVKVAKKFLEDHPKEFAAMSKDFNYKIKEVSSKVIATFLNWELIDKSQSLVEIDKAL